MSRDYRQRNAVRFANRLPAQSRQFPRFERIHGRFRCVLEFHGAERGEETVVADVDDGGEVAGSKQAVDPFFDSLIARSVVVQTHVSDVHQPVKAADAYARGNEEGQQACSFIIRDLTRVRSASESDCALFACLPRAGVEPPVGVAQQSDEEHRPLGGLEVVERAEGLQPVVLPVAGRDVERGVVLAAAVEGEIPAEEKAVGGRANGNRAGEQALIGGVGQIHRGEESARRARLDRAVVGVDLGNTHEKGKRGIIGWLDSEEQRREPAFRDDSARPALWSARTEGSGLAPHRRRLFRG